MLEWLVMSGATVGATELGKAVFEQVLKLGQTAAEDYVKDFFKGCLKEGVAAAKPEVAKKAVASALQAFLLLVTDELEDQELSKAQIRDRYDSALIHFVKNESVKPILGSAFEKDCSAIDNTTLATLWQQSTLRSNPFPAMPEGFDWQRIGSEYLKKVRRIVRETPELRSLLETELLEDIARNTAHLNTQISPGFDVATYRDSLQTSYGYLKLSTIDTTDQQYRVKLWKMFIEQTVREALPPRQTAEASEQETLEHDRREYFQQPSRKVLEAIGQVRSSLTLLQKEGTGVQSPPFEGGFRGIEPNAQRAVILGDPGAGKSTLLQYLALEWVEGTLIPSPSPTGEGSQIHSPSPVGEVRADRLPLLIELREYAIAQTNSFLDFLHRGRGVDWQFDQQQLHQYLQEHPTLVMFDGLDEVFDRPTQAAIIDDIIRFAQQYPHAQILTTSRIIGYNPERLQHAGFRHFTIQPLDTDEIHEFIDRWYTLALGNDPDKERLKQRLKDAIANSTAIQNLADNPLLLTMMAILNRRQELPRDRADLYDQASRVLLYHWDVDHKKLNLPLDTIGRREKQEMLRLVAYEMQAGDEGLKGNLISADRLTRILTDYLRDQGFSEPREKANKLIDQLRHRNFILCDRGADNYGFVHRTFLEYFCAVEIVNRFEKQRTLTFEQLRDEVFGQHWQDETWHEVLRLICGMIDAKFAGELIEFLMTRECDRATALKYDNDKERLKPEGFTNLLLAIDCWVEVSTPQFVSLTHSQLFDVLKNELENPDVPLLFETTEAILTRILLCFPKTDVLPWLKSYAQQAEDWRMREATIYVIAEQFKAHPDTLTWLETLSQQDVSGPVRWTAFTAIVRLFRNTPEHLPSLKTIAQQEDTDTYLREASVRAIGQYFNKYPDTFSWLIEFIGEEQHSPPVRWSAMKTITKHYSSEPQTLSLLKYCAQEDKDEWIRARFTTEIARTWKDNLDVLAWLKLRVQNEISVWSNQEIIKEIANIWKNITGLEILSEIIVNSDIDRYYPSESTVLVNPRLVALIAITENYPTHPKTLELLRDRAINDSDEQLREWAQEQLKMQNVEFKKEDNSNG